MVDIWDGLVCRYARSTHFKLNDIESSKMAKVGGRKVDGEKTSMLVGSVYADSYSEGMQDV